MTICRYHIKEMIIFLRKIQRCSVSTPVSTLNNTGVMLNSVDTSDNTGYSRQDIAISGLIGEMRGKRPFRGSKQQNLRTFLRDSVEFKGIPGHPNW